MPIPFVLAGLAVAAAGYGVKKGYDAYEKSEEADKLQNSANGILANAKRKNESARKSAQNALKNLGRAKINIWEHSISRFLELCDRIDMEEVIMQSAISTDEAFFDDLKQCEMEVSSMLAGGIGGIGAGGLAAFGAYSATMALASASTGTAIATLSGAAATNATLAWLGGGSLAAGGFGMAGGAAVLGGLVAGPALAVIGVTLDSASEKKLETARSNLAQARKTAEEIETITKSAHLLRRKVTMVENLLTRLDMIYNDLLDKFENVVKSCGEDYKTYDENSKKIVVANVKITETIKRVLDTSIIDDKGNITEECDKLLDTRQAVIENSECLNA